MSDENAQRPYKLAVVATHPIQYQSPWFRAMAADPRLDLHVFFGHNATATDQASAGFGVQFEWDVPLLDGYPYSFLRNVARRPSVGTFRGIDTPEVSEVIRRGGYDAVLVNGWNHKSSWQAILACWRSKTKVMVRGDSHLRTARSNLKKVIKALTYRAFIPRFDACLAVGIWSREYYMHYGARPDRVFVVPHVVNESWLCGEAARFQPLRLDLRRQWGLGEKSTVFVFAGKLIPKKRVRDFIRALQQAANSGAAVEGLVVGDGPLRSECETLVSSSGVPVRFAGFLNQSEIVKAYIAADMLVLPSDGGETWGLVVNEAMCCGRPCIVSDQVGCGPDLVQPGKTGAIFPLGDVDALAKLMVAFAGDEKLLQQMGIRCRQLMHGCSVQTAVDGVVAALAALQTGAQP